MSEVTKTVDPEIAAKDRNGDGHISLEEYELDMEFKRKELEDADAMRDAQRKMAWFALFGMLLYPFAVVLAVGLACQKQVRYLEVWQVFTLYQLQLLSLRSLEHKQWVKVRSNGINRRSKSI